MITTPLYIPESKSIIDYIIVPIETIEQCVEFKVKTSRDMVNTYCNITDVNIDLSKIIPDHSVLTFKFDTIIQSIPRNSAQPQRNIPVQNNNAYDPNHIYFKHFNVNPLPEELLNNETSQVKLLQ